MKLFRSTVLLRLKKQKKWLLKRGLFVGPSSGGNYWAAKDIRRRYPEIKNILTFLCDRGEKYLSMLYDKED